MKKSLKDASLASLGLVNFLYNSIRGTAPTDTSACQSVSVCPSICHCRSISVSQCPTVSHCVIQSVLVLFSVSTFQTLSQSVSGNLSLSLYLCQYVSVSLSLSLCPCQSVLPVCPSHQCQSLDYFRYYYCFISRFIMLFMKWPCGYSGFRQ